MIVCVDVDNILNDLTERTIKLYNLRNNKNIQIHHITSYNFFVCLPYEDAEGIVSLFKEKALWDSLKPLPGSQNILKQLIKKGHQIYLATATDPINFEWKIDWLKQYFPFISSDNVIRIMDKNLLKCDVLIDDSLDNLTTIFCERVCLDWPWNQNISKDIAYDIKRVYHWNEIINIINNIEREIKKWEK